MALSQAQAKYIISSHYVKSVNANMITDDELYRLAVFLGSATMLLIVLYHFLEVNAVEEPSQNEKSRPSPSLAEAKVGTIVR